MSSKFSALGHAKRQLTNTSWGFEVMHSHLIIMHHQRVVVKTQLLSLSSEEYTLVLNYTLVYALAGDATRNALVQSPAGVVQCRAGKLQGYENTKQRCGTGSTPSKRPASVCKRSCQTALCKADYDCPLLTRQ